MARGGLPTGTVTFLMTDIEGSTRLWEARPAEMSVALRRHDEIVTAAVEVHSGAIIRTKGEGDSAFAVFSSPADAAAAALTMQRSLHGEPWPEGVAIRVRAALHTGGGELREGDYYGPEVNRCARLRAIAHGGQTIFSESQANLARDSLPDGALLRDLGEHRLKDLERPERVFQLCHPSLPEEFPPLASLSVLRHNLPVQLTSFIGREEEMAQVRAHLASTRSMTLTGTGGCGKTRLALQVAADVLAGYPDGAWLVELASISDPGLVPAALAHVLGVRPQAGRDPTEALADHLRDRAALIVLDNCEQVVSACAGLAGHLLRACPGVRILATSRERLGIDGELVWRVPSLELPQIDPLPSLEALRRYESVSLFVERARLHKPGFPLRSGNALRVAEICRRLDGIPLAIELAAARVKVLTVEQIAERLDDRFRLLTGGSRTALERHQTLRTAVDWSYDLLSERERRLFERLSVFAGGFTLAAAEAVTSGEGIRPADVLELLSDLVDKSLAAAEERDGETRYHLLETMRQYAEEKLASSDERDALRDRHAGWCVTLAEGAEPELTGPEQVPWLERLELEHANLRAALAWSVSRRNADMSLRLAGALWRFWLEHGHLDEGRRLAEQALSLGGDDSCRAKGLRATGALAMWQSDLVAARAHHEEGFDLARRLGDERGVASSLSHLGIVAWRSADLAGAERLLQESLALRRELGDREGVGYSLGNLGLVAQARGDFAAARRFLEESLAIDRERGHRLGAAGSLTYLGELARAEGDLDRAEALHREGLTLQRELGQKETLPLSLEGLAAVAAARGQPERAARLFGASSSLRAAIGLPVPPPARAGYDRDVTLARAGVGEEAFARAWEQGRDMTLAGAISYALGKEPDPRGGEA
jgi:predicted ATPase/class 3 adenylate cyclase